MKHKWETLKTDLEQQIKELIDTSHGHIGIERRIQLNTLKSIVKKMKQMEEEHATH